MLNINYIRENPADVKSRLAIKNFKHIELVDQILDSDEGRRSTQKELDDCLAESNTLSAQIGQLFKTGKAAEANPLKEQAAQLKETSKELESKLQEFQLTQDTLMAQLPNLPHPDVKPGLSAEDNEVILEKADLSVYADNLKPDWVLCDVIGRAHV